MVKKRLIKGVTEEKEEASAQTNTHTHTLMLKMMDDVAVLGKILSQYS